MKIYYTNERNIQILISILKQNNIKKIIASPGTTNIAFVASVQNDNFFEVYSCVDERSACYMACGLAYESNEPVVLTCTGATASRNYLPGLTEAYYRKIPVLAVTCAQHYRKLGNYFPQCIDRTAQLKDIVNLSVQIPTVNNSNDEIGCNLLINKAIQELRHNGGGPVHINIETTGESTKNFNAEHLPDTKIIKRFEYADILPNLDTNKRIAIFIGSHTVFDKETTKEIEEFCEKYNSVVICDHTSNYHGKYKIIGNLIFDQEGCSKHYNHFDIIIHLGTVSGSYMKLEMNEAWRVNIDGEFRDAFSKIKNVFQMEEIDFFKKYNSVVQNKVTTSNFNILNNRIQELHEKLEQLELPLSNIWITKNLIQKIKNESTIHLAILNTLRSWNYFNTEKKLFITANTGGFGIDGPISTLIGASLANPKKNYYGIIGDLAFFYDMNVLGNRHINNNLRIILINNGCGTEFHNYSHPASHLGEMACDYIAADGHFGNKSSSLVKNYAENLGFKYLTAKNKDEVLQNLDYFLSDEIYDKPIIFEIFTNSADESNALKKIRSLDYSFTSKVKKEIKKVMGK